MGMFGLQHNGVDSMKNSVFFEDCLVTMSKMQDESVDLVLTSPPYANLRKYGGFTFNENTTTREIARVLKQGGVCVWVVGDATINGGETLSPLRQALFFQEVGLRCHDTMIYHKKNPMPLTHNRYEQAFEYMFVFSKGKPKTFNPIMDRCACFGKNHGRRGQKFSVETSIERGAADRKRDGDFPYGEFKRKQNVWTYTVGNGSALKSKHPAVFPVQLAEDHILSWSNEGDVVYDPFLGSGTTAYAASKHKRIYIGSEVCGDYKNDIYSNLALAQEV